MGGYKSFEGRGHQRRSGLAPNAHAAAQCDGCASTASFEISDVADAGSPAEISRRGPRSCIDEDPSNPSGDRQPWSGRHRGEVQFGSRVVSCPTSSCDPSSRQAPKTGEETQCSRVCKDRAGREAEAGLRGGVGTGGEGSGMFPTRGRDGTSRLVRTMLQESQDPGAALEAELSRARAELALLKGGVDPDAPCGPSVKRPCRTGEVRAALPAMPTLIPA